MLNNDSEEYSKPYEEWVLNGHPEKRVRKARFNAALGLLFSVYRIAFFFLFIGFFIFSLAAYWGGSLFESMFSFVVLLFAFLDRAKKELGDYRLTITKNIFTTSLQTKYLATLTAISAIANLAFYLK